MIYPVILAVGYGTSMAKAVYLRLTGTKKKCSEALGGRIANDFSDSGSACVMLERWLLYCWGTK